MSLKRKSIHSPFVIYCEDNNKYYGKNWDEEFDDIQDAHIWRSVSGAKSSVIYGLNMMNENLKNFKLIYVDIVVTPSGKEKSFKA